MRRTTRSGRVWPLALGLLLAISAGVNVAFVVVASRDDSFAVEPDYYARAVAWDATMAQDERNRALGWLLHVSAEVGARPGQLRLVARLADGAGAAVDGARVAVEAMHGARASSVVSGDLAGAGGGIYAADLPLRRPGLWELRFRVTRGDATFTQRVITDLPGAP